MKPGQVGVIVLLSITGHLCVATAAERTYTREQALNMQRAANTVLRPVYGPLAEEIVNEYDLAGKQGVGMDIGSGPGDLIIELCERTRGMFWIHVDINPHCAPLFLETAERAGVSNQVRAVVADVQSLPFEDNYADVVVSRGSFQFWQDKRTAFGEIYRVLKPGGTALIGRGFPETLPLPFAREIRRKKNGGPHYDVAETAAMLRSVMDALGIRDYQIRRPQPPGSEGVNYGIWLQFRKPPDSKPEGGSTAPESK